MKVLIRVRRRTEYASIVDMPDDTFARIGGLIGSDDWRERKQGEAEANELIDPKDWQDDELDYVDEFEPVEVEAQP